MSALYLFNLLQQFNLIRNKFQHNNITTLITVNLLPAIAYDCFNNLQFPPTHARSHWRCIKYSQINVFLHVERVRLRVYCLCVICRWILFKVYRRQPAVAHTIHALLTVLVWLPTRQAHCTRFDVARCTLVHKQTALIFISRFIIMCAPRAELYYALRN